MKKVIFIAVMVTMLTSCGTSTECTNANCDSTVVDSTVVVDSAAAVAPTGTVSVVADTTK